MKGLLPSLVYLSFAIVLPLKASGLELMLASDLSEPRLLVSDASTIDRATIKKAERYRVPNPAQKEQIAQRLINYPNGTVVYVFRDGNDEIKGMFPVLAQPERLVSSSRPKASPQFQPSVMVIDVPETLILRFEATEVWSKSESAHVEYLGDILIGPESR